MLSRIVARAAPPAPNTGQRKLANANRLRTSPPGSKAKAKADALAGLRSGIDADAGRESSEADEKYTATSRRGALRRVISTDLRRCKCAHSHPCSIYTCKFSKFAFRIIWAATSHMCLMISSCLADLRVGPPYRGALAHAFFSLWRPSQGALIFFSFPPMDFYIFPSHFFRNVT